MLKEASITLRSKMVDAHIFPSILSNIVNKLPSKENSPTSLPPQPTSTKGTSLHPPNHASQQWRTSPLPLATARLRPDPRHQSQATKNLAMPTNPPIPPSPSQRHLQPCTPQPAMSLLPSRQLLTIFQNQPSVPFHPALKMQRRRRKQDVKLRLKPEKKL